MNASAQAWKRHLAQELGAKQPQLQADLNARFLDLREAYLHRLKAALGRGLDRKAALADAWARLMLAMLMATIAEGVTQQGRGHLPEGCSADRGEASAGLR